MRRWLRSLRWKKTGKVPVSIKRRRNYERNSEKIVALLVVLALAVSVVACSQTTTPPESTTAETETESTSEPEAEEAQPYTITISMPSGDGVEEGYKALAEGYKKYHPEANILIDLKPDDGYADWVKTVAADYTTTDVDVVAINYLNAEKKDGMAINWNEYVEQVNPYDAEGKIWKDCFNYSAQISDPIDGSFDALCLRSV